MSNQKRLKAMAKHIPHVESRMPYTYHHDAVRLFIQQKTGELLSRSDVSQMGADEEQLYTIGIYQAIQELTPLQMLDIPLEHVRELKEIYQRALVLIPYFFEKNYKVGYVRK
jgi:hypothetical protein